MNKNIKLLVEIHQEFIGDDIMLDIDNINIDVINDYAVFIPKNNIELREHLKERLVKGIKNFNYIDVSELEDFTNVFANLNIEDIDISLWNVSNGRIFNGMFFNCRQFNCDLSNWKLDKAENCYLMFALCEKLTSTPLLTNMNLGEPFWDYNNVRGCYESMFWSCLSLTKAPELPALKLTPMCYKSMFCYCSSLEEAPELPALELASECYISMFNECTNLSYINVLSKLKLIDRYSRDWVGNVKNKNGTFIYNKNAKWKPNYTNYCVPEGWEIIKG